MSLAARSDNNSILIVVPWLQGGGAQGALLNIMKKLPLESVTLVILFRGNRNHESVKNLASSCVELGFAKSPLGVWRAMKGLKPYIDKSSTIYSLMRASHLVLGLLPKNLLKGKRLAATFHQLPSQDSRGLHGKIENIFVRKGLRHAELITAPSDRAIQELLVQKIGSPSVNSVEQNIISASTKTPIPPRVGVLPQVRLVFAGRLTKQKGLDRVGDLLRASEVSVELRCLGDGQARMDLLKVASDLSNHHTIELISHVDDITKHLDWADAVFLPSRWELNPLVVWEGRARGRATLGSSIEPFRDLSESGPMWLFDGPDRFDKIVQNIARSPEMRQDAFQEALESYKNINMRSLIVQYLRG